MHGKSSKRGKLKLSEAKLGKDALRQGSSCRNKWNQRNDGRKKDGRMSLMIYRDMIGVII